MLRRNLRRRVSAVLAAAALAALVGCSSGDGSDDASTPTTTSVTIGGVAPQGGDVAWPAPPSDQVAALADAAGVPLETREQLAFHVHAHLDVYIDGEHRTVPAGLGIVIDDPGVQTFTDGGVLSYGGIEGCDQGCISPLHTHDVSGVLHTETATPQENTLGQLFGLWDVRLDATCVDDFCTPDTPIHVYVDGEERPFAHAGDIALSDHEEIALVIGASPSQIPDAADFSAA